MHTAYLRTPISFISIEFDDEFNLIKITKSDKFVISDRQNYPEKIRNLIGLLDGYFSGRVLEIDYPFKLVNVTEFDKKVLDTIRKIPFGKTVSYKWISDILKNSPRAVGQALKRNPLPIILPCHRVIKSNGQLGGYSLGLEFKKWLIEHEKAILYKLQSHKT